MVAYRPRQAGTLLTHARAQLCIAPVMEKIWCVVVQKHAIQGLLQWWTVMVLTDLANAYIRIMHSVMKKACFKLNSSILDYFWTIKGITIYGPVLTVSSFSWLLWCQTYPNKYPFKLCAKLQLLCNLQYVQQRLRSL